MDVGALTNFPAESHLKTAIKGEEAAEIRHMRTKVDHAWPEILDALEQDKFRRFRRRMWVGVIAVFTGLGLLYDEIVKFINTLAGVLT